MDDPSQTPRPRDGRTRGLRAGLIIVVSLCGGLAAVWLMFKFPASSGSLFLVKCTGAVLATAGTIAATIGKLTASAWSTRLTKISLAIACSSLLVTLLALSLEQQKSSLAATEAAQKNEHLLKQVMRNLTKLQTVELLVTIRLPYYEGSLAHYGRSIQRLVNDNLEPAELGKAFEGVRVLIQSGDGTHTFEIDKSSPHFPSVEKFADVHQIFSNIEIQFDIFETEPQGYSRRTAAFGVTSKVSPNIVIAGRDAIARNSSRPAFTFSDKRMEIHRLMIVPSASILALTLRCPMSWSNVSRSDAILALTDLAGKPVVFSALPRDRSIQAYIETIKLSADSRDFHFRWIQDMDANIVAIHRALTNWRLVELKLIEDQDDGRPCFMATFPSE